MPQENSLSSDQNESSSNEDLKKHTAADLSVAHNEQYGFDEVLISSGTFMMHSQHEVELTQRFYIMKNLITQELCNSVCGYTLLERNYPLKE